MMAQRPGYGPPSPVPIFQWHTEFDRLLDIYRHLEPLAVLEIGTFYGGTLYHWLRNASPGACIVTVDSYAVGVDNRHLYPDWVPDGVQLEAIQGDSREPSTVEQVAPFGPFDFIWIDAGHYYREVAEDWRNYRPLGSASGIIAFHDILPPTEAHPEIEVDRLWQEIQRDGYVTQEIIENPDAEWGGIGVVWL